MLKLISDRTGLEQCMAMFQQQQQSGSSRVGGNSGSCTAAKKNLLQRRGSNTSLSLNIQESNKLDFTINELDKYLFIDDIRKKSYFGTIVNEITSKIREWLPELSDSLYFGFVITLMFSYTYNCLEDIIRIYAFIMANSNITSTDLNSCIEPYFVNEKRSCR